MEVFFNDVIAYHIVWTTYGTWLPGDWRGWIKKGSSGIQMPDLGKEKSARQRMAEPMVVLNSTQRLLVDQTVTKHCHIRDWLLHAVNARSNHIHVVVSANIGPEEVRDQLKAWCSRKLSDAVGLSKRVAKKSGRRRWFTQGGDCEKIYDEEYLTNAIRYVLDGQ